MSEPIRDTIRIECVFDDGFLRTGMAEHMWRLDDPLAVDVKFTIAINSIPITKDEFLVEPNCGRCQGKLRFGTYGVLVVGEPPLRCINCAHTDHVLQVQEETWTIGLPVFIEGLLDRADRVITDAADIVMTRPSSNWLLLRVRSADGSMKVSLPVAPVKYFLSKVNDARKALGPSLDKCYTESGIDALEKLANGVD